MTSILEALEGDLRRWGCVEGALPQTARLLAAALDSEPSAASATDLARELRLVVRAIRDLAPPDGPGEVERFLASVQADEFR